MYYNLLDLKNLFHQPCECITTQGIQDGIILKFATSYLKIYDNKKNNSYHIEGYRYTCNTPVFIDDVPYNQIRQYAGLVMSCKL